MRSRPSPTIGELAVERPAPRLSRRDIKTSIVLWALCLIVYNANLRLIAPGDTYPARYLPFGLWRYHTLLVDPILPITAQGRRVGMPAAVKTPPGEFKVKAYWLVWGKDGHAISTYPVAVPVLLAPLYLPAVLYLHARGWDSWRLDWVARVMEKLSASLLAATSAALLYLALRRRAGPRLALVLALAYAFGTTTWMIGSQALWQHGMAELLIAGMLLAVTGPATVRAAIVAGLLGGLIACNRPPDSLLAAAIGLYGLRWAGRRVPVLVAAALAPVALVLAYNFSVAGHYAGGYGLVGGKEFFYHGAAAGVAGLLFSPARGLFVFSPFLLFLPIFVRRAAREGDGRLLTMAMGLGVVLQVALYAKADWRQGAVWGPRWLTSMLPMLIWMLAPVYVELRRAGRIVFLTLCAVAVAIEAIGAFWYNGASNAAIFAVDAGPGAMRNAWDPRNAPFLAELRHAPAPAELTTAVHGTLDIARSAGGLDLSAASGNAIAVEGWALANGHTPFEVAVMLDGEVVAGTRDFFARPDVANAVGARAPTGWRLTVPPRNLAGGEHLLAVFVIAVEHGNTFFLADRRFRISQAEEPAVRQAAAEIARAQQYAGYWSTAFSDAARYEPHRQELNTFLNSIMVDMLDPVAERAGLGSSIQRARQFLAAQIEPGGLVRYHGLPGLAGALGCTITPDADDTALVWRIAPGTHREWLQPALRTLAEFRTPEGLYRTWLAPVDRYQCLDPGKDPDPADVAIQMHVYMLLAEQNPAAARSLCRALEKTIVRDDIWVYYKVTSLVPILRVAGLEKAGCPLELPAARLRTSVPGQEVWVRAARMLQAFERRGGPAPAKDEVAGLLDTLSRDSFALVRQAPPLLYHNDLTASVPRYYWSEEFGYALWLRLHFASAHDGGAQ